MRSQSTVLVLGAGASAGLNLPLGIKLKEIIENDLRSQFDDFGRTTSFGDHSISRVLSELNSSSSSAWHGQIGHLYGVCNKISSAMRLQSSIDEYVERNQSCQATAICAKIAIGNAILKAEKSSTIYFEAPHEDYNDVQISRGFWLADLLGDITHGFSVTDIDKSFSNISVINFNYDRCFQQYLLIWLQQLYGLSLDSATSIISTMKIWHPYGNLGSLFPRQTMTAVPFGGERTPGRLISIANNIKTYSETIDSIPQWVQESIRDANNIVFLGFAFHRQNVKLLEIPEHFSRPTRRAYATLYDVSESRRNLIQEELRQVLRVIDPAGLTFRFVSGDCEAFWKEYGSVLAS